MISTVAVAFCVIAALLSAGCAVTALVLARSARVAALPEVLGMQRVAAEARSEVVALRAEWKAYMGALDAAMEAIDDKADTIQRRRQRVEQSERRAAALKPSEDTDSMEAAFARARAQGLPV